MCWLQIIPPVFSVYPVEDADRVFQKLSQSQINGRAVFRVSMSSDSDAELFSADDDTISTPTDPMTTASSHDDDNDGTEPAFFVPHSDT